MNASFDLQRESALALDAADPLAAFRDEFALPADPHHGTAVYLCGHSLGLAPIAAAASVEQELKDWRRLAVLGHEAAERPWIGYAEQLAPALAQLCGAQESEVTAMNSLSVNLHLLLAALFRPQGQRCCVLIEAGAFSSDRHVVASQLRWHGLDPERCLLEIAPRAGEELLRIEDIEARIAAEAPRLALVLWPGVQFRTGQSFDLARIARATHAAGVLLCADLAHAIGNVPLALHEQDIDCAAWCSYKYLNAGPGAIGGLFVHQRLHERAARNGLQGWWGHEGQTRFRMEAEFRPAAGAAALALSNPPVFSTAPLLASLQQFQRAGLPALRAKSLQLTAYLEYLLQHRCGEQITQVTSTDPQARGAQLSVRVRGGRSRARAVFDALQPRGLIADWREPDIIRLAPAPLYNSFEDVWRAADILAATLQANG
jgi:kynureninase